MQLLAPLALIAFAPIAAAIIVLYLLKLRRRDFVIPSVFLWRRAVQDVQANAPFQKLRANLLLLLQLLAVACVIVGLASPFVMARRLGGKSVIIVLDASASMRATDAPGERFGEAQRLAEGIVKGMGRRDEAALIVCGDRAQTVVSFSGDRGRLLSAIRDAQPTDCITGVRDGMLLALSLAAKRPQTQVYLISDGAFAPLPAVASSAEVRFLRVGEGSNNVALLAFESAGQQKGGGQQLFVRLRNYSADRKHCVLSISHEDELVHASELDLGPGESQSQTYQLSLAKPGLLKAELEVDDDLTADNVAYTFARPTTARRVLLVTPGNLFLEQALVVMPEVEVFKAASLSASDAAVAYRDYDVVIFDRVAPPSEPKAGAVMLIGAGMQGVAALGAEVAAPAITSWEDQHPALRYANLGVIQLAKARRLSPGPGATVLARAAQAPVVVARQAPGFRGIAFGWDLLDSDLPLRVSFPVLLSNTIQWLAQSNGGAAAQRQRPGTVLRFSAPAGAQTARLRLPDGTERRVSAADGGFTIAGCTEVGAYSLRAGDRVWRWAMDVRSEAESGIAPADQITLGRREVKASAGPPRVEQQLWPLLVAVALVVLLAEWHVYHRRM
ncbi:MAG: VWA domain-containing protein [Armatimonadota bacterium]